MRVTPSSLVRFLRQQIVYIAISAIAGAVFWAIGQQINPLTILVYSIAIGNIVVPVTQRLHRYYSEKPFPYNWLLIQTEKPPTVRIQGEYRQVVTGIHVGQFSRVAALIIYPLGYSIPAWDTPQNTSQN